MIPLVVASEAGRAQTGLVAMPGRGCRTELFCYDDEWNVLESSAIEDESSVYEVMMSDIGILSSAGHEKSCVNLPGPSGKAKYSRETDSRRVP